MIEKHLSYRGGKPPLTPEMREAFFRTGERPPLRRDRIVGVDYVREPDVEPPSFRIVVDIERTSVLTGKKSQSSVGSIALGEESAAKGLVAQMNERGALARANEAIDVSDAVTYATSIIAAGGAAVATVLITTAS